MTYNGAVIWSGEGEVGTYERHTGRPTWRAIARRLARERCGGDRWAIALVPAGEGYAETSYCVLGADGMPTGDLRDIDETDLI
jgi:hypothetical protein